MCFCDFAKRVAFLALNVVCRIVGRSVVGSRYIRSKLVYIFIAVEYFGIVVIIIRVNKNVFDKT